MDDPLDIPSNVLKNFKRTLARKLFIGEYVERRYIGSLQCYRDVIIINNNENEVIECLKSFLDFIQSYDTSSRWVGIAAEEGTSNDSIQRPKFVIFVELEQQILGTFWYQIHTIKCNEKEVSVKVKSVRPYEGHQSVLSSQTLDESIYKVKQILTLDNLYYLVKFSAVLLMAAITFVANIVLFIGDYSLKFIYAVAVLIDASTPFLLSLLDFFARCTAGFYWLILMLWRGKHNSPPINALPAKKALYLQYKN